MLEQIFTYFHFAYRQRTAFLAALEAIRQLVTFKVPAVKIGATMMAIVELFSAAILDTPRTPRGPELDLSGYELVFEDEFEGDSFDPAVWKVVAGEAGQVSARDGNLIMRADYRDGAWRIADLEMQQDYCKGYYEIRCKVFNNTSRKDIWSAFWITGDGVYDPAVSKGGVGGCEIDIYESFADTADGLDHPVGITPAIWCNGVDEGSGIDGINFGQWRSNDPVEEYNTYGVLWTDEYYIWYINGVECFRINYGSGPSQVPEHVRVSLCHPNCAAEDMTRTADQPGDYTIDYVRIYQLAG